MEKCTLCDTRRARRNCPALSQIICPQCCGSKREETISCPFECNYLLDGRAHEKLVEIDPEQFPNSDVRVDDDFLDENQALFAFCGANLYLAAVEVPGVLDADVRETLEAAIAKHKTSLVYEPALQNQLAAAVHRNFEIRVNEFRQKLKDYGGDAEAEAVLEGYILRLLVFLQRLAIMNNNGRARGRFFIHFLSGLNEPMSKAEAMAERQ